MPEPSPLETEVLEYLQAIAPDLYAELMSWKFCHHCGALTDWSHAIYDAPTDSLRCAHCNGLIVEWPPGYPITCDCGGDATHDHMVMHGLPITICCGVALTPPADFFPLGRVDTLRIAPSCPGVQGAEPLEPPQRPEGELTDDRDQT